MIANRRLTKRAPDAGESALFSGVFSTSDFFSSDGVPPSTPAQVTRAVRRIKEESVFVFRVFDVPV